jgi:hypothetical protein
MAARKAFGIRLDEEIVALVDGERRKRAQASGINVTLTAVVEALVRERLSDIRKADDAWVAKMCGAV